MLYRSFSPLENYSKLNSLGLFLEKSEEQAVGALSSISIQIEFISPSKWKIGNRMLELIIWF